MSKACNSELGCTPRMKSGGEEHGLNAANANATAGSKTVEFSSGWPGLAPSAKARPSSSSDRVRAADVPRRDLKRVARRMSLGPAAFALWRGLVSAEEKTREKKKRERERAREREAPREGGREGGRRTA